MDRATEQIWADHIRNAVTDLVSQAIDVSELANETEPCMGEEGDGAEYPVPFEKMERLRMAAVLAEVTVSRFLEAFGQPGIKGAEAKVCRLDGQTRACRVCSCTEARACVTDGVPCHWVGPDLCSACEGKPEGQS